MVAERWMGWLSGAKRNSFYCFERHVSTFKDLALSSFRGLWAEEKFTRGNSNELSSIQQFGPDFSNVKKSWKAVLAKPGMRGIAPTPEYVTISFGRFAGCAALSLGKKTNWLPG